MFSQSILLMTNVLTTTVWEHIYQSMMTNITLPIFFQPTVPLLWCPTHFKDARKKWQNKFNFVHRFSPCENLSCLYVTCPPRTACILRAAPVGHLLKDQAWTAYHFEGLFKEAVKKQGNWQARYLKRMLTVFWNMIWDKPFNPYSHKY